MLCVEELGPVKKLVSARSFLGRAVYRTAAYWVDGLLIDTGCAFTAYRLDAALDRFPVEQVVNTHCHEDHIGANGLLQHRRDAVIRAHPLALPTLADPRLQPLQPYRRLFWGWPEPSKAKPIGSLVNTERFTFQVLATPGHSPDHVSLYEPDEGWLFSGDAFIGGEDRAARLDYDIYAIIKSLKLLAARPLVRLFSGSGTVRDDPGAAMRHKISHLEELGQRVRHLRSKGYGVDAIRRQVLGAEPLITYLTLGHFRGEYLVQAYLRKA